MASNQYGGWSSTTNAGNIQPSDAFSRIMLMRYGGRSDSIFDYEDQRGYKREMGSALSGGGSDSYGGFRNSGMAPTNFGGGSTSSDPGGYNWGTFEENVGRGARAARNLVNFRMENKRLSAARKAKKEEDFLNNANTQLMSVYGAGTDPYSQSYNAAATGAAKDQQARQLQSNYGKLGAVYGAGQDPFSRAYTGASTKMAKEGQAAQLSTNYDRLSAVYGAGQDPLTQGYATEAAAVTKAQEGQKARSAKEFASRVIPPAQNMTADLRAEEEPLVPGAYQSIRGRASQPVNLLLSNRLSSTPGTLPPPFPPPTPSPKKGSRRTGKSSPYSGPQPPAPPSR